MHWNLFVVLESDLATVSRYIEFDERNYDTFSTELSKLLLSTCSEVDVILREICRKVAPESQQKNMVEYFKVINAHTLIKAMLVEETFIPRFGVTFKPFQNWDYDNRPKWWKSYNNVKHNRIQNYHEASLGNVLLAISALMICTFYLEKLSQPKLSNKQISSALKPDTQLLKLNEDYYYDTIVS